MTISHTNAQTATGSSVSSLTLNYTIGDANAEALYVGMCDTDFSGDEDVVSLTIDGVNIPEIDSDTDGTRFKGHYLLLKADFPADITAVDIVLTLTGVVNNVAMAVCEITAADVVRISSQTEGNDGASPYDINHTTTEDGGLLIGGACGGATHDNVSPGVEIAKINQNNARCSLQRETAPATAGSADLSWTSSDSPGGEAQFLAHLMEGALGGGSPSHSAHYLA